MSESELDEYARLLGDVAEIDSVWADPEVAPSSSSLAAAELQAALGEPGRTETWGEAPVREAYALAGMKYEVALDHAKAIAGLMTARATAGVMTGRLPSVSVSVSALARALAEVASHVWWLLEPDIGHVNRVRRLQLLRYRSAVEGQNAAKADGVPEDDLRHYTQTKAQVEDYSRTLELHVPERAGRQGYICGGQKLPTATSLVKQMFEAVDLPSAYPVLSGYSHGEPFALWRELERTADNTGIHYRPVMNKDTFKSAVAVASYALHPPAYRMMRLYGLG